MKYEDWKDAKERINRDRNYVRYLDDENYVALDIAQQIRNYEFQISIAKQELKGLKKAAKKLPTPDPKKVDEIDHQIVNECGYRFLGRRGLERKLYGYPKAME